MNIYISHPYSAKEENKLKVEHIIENLVKEHPEHTYISPIHTFCFMYDKVDYETGINMCLELLKLCDMMYGYLETIRIAEAVKKKLNSVRKTEYHTQ